ncbi:hypothetical protein BUY91_07755 [Staphylococcus equorum]|uniref:hypothetical protein n=1 Tax=Staphylococcus equorum TaxID=246432 RepID=UPI000D1C565D|nr:hypothetical protein [Staphylococcus equorum]PTE27616.1 hypothetical protein BUY91_07755 [Staphylococcus equorum]
MKISKILNKTELPFVDIDTNEDTALFIDPLFIEFISSREDNPINSLSLEATQQIDAFFEEVARIHQSKSKDKKSKFLKLFSHFKEPQQLKLGLSQIDNSGKGTTAKELAQFFMNDEVKKFINNKNLSLKYSYPLIKNFADDKLSDLVSNIIMNIIIKYNQQLLIDLPELQGYQSNEKHTYYYFSSKTKKWEVISFCPFSYDGVSFILVPNEYATKKQSSNLERLIDSYIEEPISKEPKIKIGSKFKRITKKAYKKKYIAGNRLENAKSLYEKASSQSHKKYQNKIYQHVRAKLTD